MTHLDAPRDLSWQPLPTGLLVRPPMTRAVMHVVLFVQSAAVALLTNPFGIRLFKSSRPRTTPWVEVPPLYLFVASFVAALVFFYLALRALRSSTRVEFGDGNIVVRTLRRMRAEHATDARRARCGPSPGCGRSSKLRSARGTSSAKRRRRYTSRAECRSPREAIASRVRAHRARVRAPVPGIGARAIPRGCTLVRVLRRLPPMSAATGIKRTFCGALITLAALGVSACSSEVERALDQTTAAGAAQASATASDSCTTDDDCSPGPCRTSMCRAGHCWPNASLDGTEVNDPIEGDCARVVCNADGTTRSETDDADIPIGTECVTLTCSGGSVVSTPKLAGAACTSGLCDGVGTCAQGVGTSCNHGQDCPSGFCVDGVCCNESCTGECKSCSVEGSKGICGNVPYYQADTSFVPSGGDAPVTCDVPIAGSRCNGAGQCLRLSGITCNLDAQCMSGDCSNWKCLGAKGEMCSAHADCVSGACAMGACK
jgi:hypothetical protein